MLGDISFDTQKPGSDRSGLTIVRKDDGTCTKNGVVVPCSQVMPTLVAGGALAGGMAILGAAFSIGAPIAITAMVKKTTRSSSLAFLSGVAAFYWLGPKITDKNGKQIFPLKFWEK